MSRAAVKICGLTDAQAVDAAVRGHADHIGFVFFAPSPRNVALSDAAALSARAEGKVKRVGLFVDADDALLGESLAAARLDALQLHGQETPERAAQIKARFGLPVWKALLVAAREDVARADIYTGAADLILFDAKTPKGALPGGMGLSFDWNLLAGWKGAVAWGLAGGLTPMNVADAIRVTGAPLVDTSSGVESAPGVKDAASITAFIAAVRAA